MSDGDDAPRPAPQAWLDALAAGEADIAAGRTSSWEDVRARLLAQIVAMEADLERRRA